MTSNCTILLATIALLIAIGLALLREYWIYIPGIIVRLRDPISPNQAVIWDSFGIADTTVEDRPPNVVLIVVDDLGFNDISFYGGGVHNGNITTPNIDSIAQNGVYFSNAYAGHATCAPSRAALMTGRYPSRVGYEFTPTHPLYAKILGTSPKAVRKGIYHKELANKLSTDNMTLPSSEFTIAEYMKKLDYRTIMLGKVNMVYHLFIRVSNSCNSQWHLGDTPGTKPIDRGFDETLGFNMISKYLPDTHPKVVNYMLDDMLDKMLWANVGYYVSRNGGPKFAPSEFLTDYFATEAAQAIKANKHRPFFMYMAFTSPHTPLQALRDDYDKLSHIDDELTRVYGAIMISLDRAVGTILDALVKEGIRENTVVIFTNDNGAPSWVMRNGSNKPFRGWKGTLFEGGLRVPMFMQWPKRIKPGSIVTDMIGHVDILPTILACTGLFGVGESVDSGIKKLVGEDILLDGVNLLPFINDNKAIGNIDEEEGSAVEISDLGHDVPHKSLFWRSGHYKAIRKGDWKLQIAERPEVEWMFDLKHDPYEMNNVAYSKEHAEIRADLLSELLQIDGEQSKPLWASITETAVTIDKFFEHDEKDDDEYVYWPN